MKKIISVLMVLAAVLPAGFVLASSDPAGTNIKDSTGTIYFITQDGQRRPYTSAGAFLSYGLNSFSNVKTAGSDDLALPTGTFIPPQDGKIICSDRGGDKGTCYLISQSTKIGFPSASIFTGQGFSFKNALYGDTSFLNYSSNVTDGSQAHAPGVLIKNAGTIYLVGANGLMGIPSMQTFLSWGYTLTDVVAANAADKAQTSAGIMPTHSQGLLSPLAGNVSLGQNTNQNPPSPTPTPIIYQTQGNTTTPVGAITISTDSSAPAAQSISMSKQAQLVHAINFTETSGNEAVNLRGLVITATVTGGINASGVLSNSGYYTLKNFTLVNGSTVITRTGFSSATPPREGGGSQTYVIDFNAGLPLNFQIASSSSLTLGLKVDTNDWQNNAAANSVWTFSIASPNDVTLTGQLSGAGIVPTINNSAVSGTTTVIKQPITFNPVTSFSQGPNYATALSAGVPTTQETMGIFNSISHSTAQNLTSITLSQSGSALPTGTSSPVTYYIFDSSKSLVLPVGIGTVSGSASATISLNLNTAVNSGVNIPADGSGYLIIKADTTNFSTCTAANGCSSPNTYGLSITNWQYTDPALSGQTFNGPFGTDTAKNSAYSGGSARTY